MCVMYLHFTVVRLVDIYSSKQDLWKIFTNLQERKANKIREYQ